MFQHRCFPVNITKFLRTALYMEHLSGCFWTLILATQILTKNKKEATLYFDNSHANQTDIPKIYDFFHTC